MKRKGNGLHLVYKSLNIFICTAEGLHGLEHCRGRSQTGVLGWGFYNSGLGEQGNLFIGKKLDA